MNRFRRSLLVTEHLMQALPVGPVDELKHDAQSTVDRPWTHRAKGHAPGKLRHQQAYDPGAFTAEACGVESASRTPQARRVTLQVANLPDIGTSAHAFPPEQRALGM
ncbi:hypothetical protein [Cupriavidus necator]